jgi:hypothetical protein
MIVVGAVSSRFFLSRDVIMGDPPPSESDLILILAEADEVAANPQRRVPNIESIHRDLALANAYRQEFIKSLILICGGLFAFSVAFRPELRAITHEGLFWIAWIGLAVSMLGGFGQLAAWERFYSSYQRFEWKGKDGKSRREAITFLRRIFLILQVVGFVLGVAALGSFTAFNLGNVERTKPAATMPVRP